MANKRTFQLDTAVSFLDQYVPVDKTGNAEAEKLPISSLYTERIVKGSSVAVTAGNTPILFAVPFDIGITDYALIVWGIDSSDNEVFVKYIQSSKTENGFTAVADFDCTFNYIAVKG